MRKILTIFLILAFAIAATSAAFASGYNSPLWSTSASNPEPEPKKPHGGYADTTNKCKDCHSVHLATGGYKLLRSGAEDGQTACSYCHGVGGIVGSKNGAVLNTAGHGLDVNQLSQPIIYAPNDSTPGYSVARKQWGCTSCHSVHNQNLVSAVTERVFTTSNATNVLLKGKPDSSSPGNGLIGQTVTLSRWCTECHGANHGTYGQGKEYGSPSVTVYGHDSGSTAGINRYVYSGQTYAFVRQNVPGNLDAAPRCNQCHAAGAGVLPTSSAGWVSGQLASQIFRNQATGEGFFPHGGYSNSYSLLKASNSLSSAGDIKLDDVCNDCHYTPSLP